MAWQEASTVKYAPVQECRKALPPSIGVIAVRLERLAIPFQRHHKRVQVAKILYRLNGALRKRDGRNVFIKLANDKDKFVSLTTKPGPRTWETTYRQRKSDDVLFWEGDGDSQTWFKVTNLYYNAKDHQICTWLKKIARSADEILGVRKAGNDARVTVWFQADETDQAALVNKKIRKFLGRNVLITSCSAPAAGANYLVQDMVEDASGVELAKTLSANSSRETPRMMVSRELSELLISEILHNKRQGRKPRQIASRSMQIPITHPNHPARSLMDVVKL